MKKETTAHRLRREKLEAGNKPIQFWVTSTQHEILRLAALADGRSLASWVKHQVLTQVKQASI